MFRATNMEKGSPASKTLKVPYSRHFLEWLNSQQVSIGFTTYQTNRLCLVGVKPDGQISTPVWEFDRPMGLYATAERFYLSTRYQIWRFENVLENGELLQEKYDKLYVPRIAYTTGDIDIHDLVADDTGGIVFTNTEYSCLATLHPKHSFTPIWKPPFITKLAPEDRCHLNGLAVVDGKPRYVTAISRSDVASSWRGRRVNGGVVVDIQTNDIIASGLSMPHSPRWYRGKLWLLNSGTGDFGYVENGEFVPVTFCPGYGRGLAFVGDYAVVGLSKPRDYHFSDLLIGERLKEKETDPRCGILIIDLKSGDIFDWLDLDTEATELYDVAILPGVRCPMALGFKTGNIARLVTMGGVPETRFFQKTGFLDRSSSNLSVKTPTTQAKKQPSLLPLAVWLFGAVNWEKGEKFVEAIALIYASLNQRVKQPSFSFLSRQQTDSNNSQKAQGYFSQGQALKQQGKYEEAAAYFQKAIKADKTYLPAYNNLGTILQNQGRFQEAINCHQSALKINPNSPQSIANIASIYLLQGELDKAEEGFNRALKIKPDLVPALYNLGLIYKQQAKLDDAIKLFQTAAKHKRDYADAYFQLGQIWEFQSQFTLTKLAYERVLQINPQANHLDYHLGLVKMNLCDWEGYDEFIEQFIESTAKYAQQEKGGFTLAPFQLNAIPLPPELSLEVARRHAEGINKSIARKKPQFSYSQKTDKIRIGYVSPDFRHHAVGRLISGIFEGHDRDKFEVFGYHLLNASDEITETIKNGCDEFRDIYQNSAETAARQINNDGIDILIDLAGYTGYGKPEIFAGKPAPIQATFLGYPNTMGADFIQYLLTDKWIVPPELAEYYSEEIIYLPHQFICSPMEVSQKQFTRADFGLPEEGFVFACLNRHYKITPQLFEVWMRVLQQVEGSVLWLSFATTEEVVNNLRNSAATSGIPPERLIFAEKLPHPEYLARLSLADLALDTLVYNGGSTTVAALYAGLPVLTKPGSTNAARMGASICASGGMEELICRSLEEYEAKAVGWATHPEELQQLRQRLKARNAPLFDLSGFVASLEAALEGLLSQ